MAEQAEYGLDQQDVNLIQQLLRDWKARFPWLRPLLRRRGGAVGGGGTKLRLAQIAEILSNTDYITASLLNESTGIAATEGTGFEITVYARISGGARLDRASPQVAIGGIFEVRRHAYDNDGTAEQRWWFVQNFHAAETYIGENP